MVSTTRIHLIRHGQVAGHEQPRYNGQADVALTELGMSQYHRLKDRLSSAPISGCYTSDLSRCTIGADLICAEHAIEPIRRRELRELDIGIWEGLTWSEINE